MDHACRYLDQRSTGVVHYVENSLKNGSLSCICSSNNQDSEPDLWESAAGTILLRGHSSKVLQERKLVEMRCLPLCAPVWMGK